MKILLTGGAGFIGSHIADLLIAEGHSVMIIDDLSTGSQDNIPPQAAFHAMDITDTSVDRVFAEYKPEIMIHEAARVSVNASVKNPLGDLDVNIRGTVALLQLCVQHGVQKVVFASTGGAIYGEQDSYPADENHQKKPLSPYGIAKLSAEYYLHFFFTTYGIPYVALRYSNVYGPRQDPYGEGGVVAIFSRKFLAHEQPVINGTGEQTRDFVFVEDVARANLMAVQKNFHGEINIGTAEETSINQLFETMRDATGSVFQPAYAPALPGEVFRSVLANDKAAKELDWRPSTTLREGIEKTVRFFAHRSRTL